MIIGGLQKLSLVDFPGKISSVVFTQGCAFRCRYCHNPDLVIGPNPACIEEKKVLEYLSEHRNMLEGVVVTGGEPTLHKDLETFLYKIKALGLLIKLDSNGMNPDTLRSFFDEGLVDYVAMDIKAPWDRYNKIIQVSETMGPERCKRSLEVIQESGVDHEFRTTVFPQVHTEEDFMTMVGYLQRGERYFVQNIRYAVTLDPKVDKSAVLDVSGIVTRLRQKYPDVVIDER